MGLQCQHLKWGGLPGSTLCTIGFWPATSLHRNLVSFCPKGRQGPFRDRFCLNLFRPSNLERREVKRAKDRREVERGRKRRKREILVARPPNEKHSLDRQSKPGRLTLGQTH